MGLDTLFAAPVFQSGRVEKLIRGLFIANGILGLLTPIGYGLNLPLEILFGGLLLWDTIMFISTALLAYQFRQVQHQAQSIEQLRILIETSQKALD